MDIKVIGVDIAKRCQRAPKFPQKWARSASKIPWIGDGGFASVISRIGDRIDPLAGGRVVSALAVS